MDQATDPDAINISDVIEIINADAATVEVAAVEGAGGAEGAAAVGGPTWRQQGEEGEEQEQEEEEEDRWGSLEVPPAAAAMSGGPGGPGAPRCVIVEQPASKALRFRYECEGRSAGSIPGVNSTADNKTYPTIQIEGYKGRAVVVVSCVTKDPPYRPHPHSLVGKEGCKKGVCTMEVNTETMTLSFANLGIQCIKKKDIDAALAQRKDLRIDPFKTGFGHRNQPGTIDLNAVRLCFQSFLEGEKNQFNRPIMPVVSEPIYDKKAMSDLVICKLSEVSASVIGGKEIILLCEKVAKEDISVRLYEELNGQVLWEGQCDFQPTEVHKQVAISFRTPKYKDIQVTQPVKVMIQLLRPSDKATSEPRPFLLTPIESDSVGLPLGRRKRPKTSNAELDLLKDSVAKMMQQSLAEVKPEIKHELGDAAVANTSSAPFGMQMMYPPTGGAHGPGGPVRKVSPVSVYASPGASPDYMAAPAPAPAYTVMGVAAPSQQHVYPPHPSPFSPASQGVASPAEHQASVSPLPQFGHPLEQINNLNMMQQHNIDNNLNIIQQQQHSPMQHNIDNMMQQQLSPMQHNIDNMMQQQHSPLQHNIDNMMQQQHSPLQHNIDNMMQQQHSPIQYNMIQQQQQHNIDNMAQQSHNIDNMAQQSHNIDNGHVVMDMDTQQHSIELSAGRLDSRELRELDLDGLDTVNENLSANLSASLRLNDASNSDGMTDSLSRIPSTSLIYYPNNNTTITTNNNNNNNNGNSFPNTDGGNQF